VEESPFNSTVYVNGTISDGAVAVVPVFDHGFLYGEGVYETLRTYRQSPFLLDRHLTRLRTSASLINLTIPQDDSELAAAITTTMRHAALKGEQYVRLIVTRGVGDLSYDPAGCPTPTVIIIVKTHRETSPENMENGIRIIISSILRNHPEAVNPRIKSNNLLNSALAMQEAIQAGAQEALMRNYRGELSECSQSNIFLVKESKVLTPSLESGLLEGVTRNFVFEIGAHTGFTVRETVLGDSDVHEADEIFITSTTREILPVTRVEDRTVGSGAPGPVTLALAAAFRRQAELLSGGSDP